MVRSKSEVIITNTLTGYGIPFSYEKDFPRYEGDEWPLQPDFAFDLPNGEDVYKRQIEYGEGIDKTYDGETNVLNVVAKHPNAKKLAESKVNQDVVFYYTWSWDTINATPAVEPVSYTHLRC